MQGTVRRVAGGFVVRIADVGYYTAPLGEEPFASLCAGDVPDKWGYPIHQIELDREVVVERDDAERRAEDARIAASVEVQRERTQHLANMD